MLMRDLGWTVRRVFASNPMRVLLTITGVTIGSGSIVVLASLLRAAQDALAGLSQKANEADLIAVVQSDPPAQERKRTTRPLSTYDGDALRQSPLLNGALVQAAGQRGGTAHANGREKRTTIVGVELDGPALYRLEIEDGRFFVEGDFAQMRRVAVVGQEVWTELLRKQPLAEGPTLTIHGKLLTVVGVLAHKTRMGSGDGTWMWDRRVLIPSTTFRSVWAPDRTVREVHVRLRGLHTTDVQLERLQNAVVGLLLRRHHGVKNFEVRGEGGSRNTEALIFLMIRILLFGTGVVALFVGGINIMNVMLVTVTERTREIGLRRALGATPAWIARQILLESAIMTTVGGLLGVAGGLLLSFGLSALLTALLAPWPFVAVPWSIAVALALAVVVGVVFGWVPAARAARLDPVVALRGD